jgi:hypothetical protein
MTNDREKKPYKKPEIKQVRLAPEEAVLGACKDGIDLNCEPDACAITVGS